MNGYNNTKKSSRSAIINLVLLLLIVIFNMLLQWTKLDLFSLLMGFVVLVIGCTSTIGLIHAIKSIKEKNTVKKIVGIVVNGAFFSLFLFAIIANIMDIYKFIST